MRVIDPGHTYLMTVYDAKVPGMVEDRIGFMKREGENYPGNVGARPGTNCQEVIRVLIDRVQYLNQQIPCPPNQRILHHLRRALIEFEQRAAERHGREFDPPPFTPIETLPTCPTCGHIGCTGHES